jgi:hypothetical protein
MATISGNLLSYSNSYPDKRMVTDRILMVDPYEIMTYNALGTDVGKFNMVNREGKVYEWLEDTYNATTGTAASSLETTTASTAMSVSAAAPFQPGDVLLADSEKIWVSAKNGTSLTVTRGWGDTVTATHATNVTLTFIGRARVDGDTAEDSPHTEITTAFNYTQILQRSVSVSRTKEKMAEYGVSSWEDYLIDKYMKELMVMLNKLPYYGEKEIGDATTARGCGGFRDFITNNLTNASSAALTRKMIDDTFQNIWDDGGNPDLIICGAFAQRKINDFYEGFIETTRDESVGGMRIKSLLHPISGTNVNIMVDRHCPTNELWILERSKIAYYPFDPFFYERLAKVGDFVNGEIVGEYGLVVAADKHHGLVYSFSTTA